MRLRHGNLNNNNQSVISGFDLGLLDNLRYSNPELRLRRKAGWVQLKLLMSCLRP
jgi:hypothetical protein